MSVMARTFRGTLMLNNAFRRTVLALRARPAAKPGRLGFAWHHLSGISLSETLVPSLNEGHQHSLQKH